MWSQSSKLTVVWFYLSSRIVISLSSHYWNVVLRIGQSFPPIIASICSTNTCVPAIKFSKTLQTPHAPFWLGSCCTGVSPAFRLGGNLCCSWLLLWGWGCGVGGSTMLAVRLQWQIEHRFLPWKLHIAVMCVTSYALLMSHLLPVISFSIHFICFKGHK